MRLVQFGVADHPVERCSQRFAEKIAGHSSRQPQRVGELIMRVRLSNAGWAPDYWRVEDLDPNNQSLGTVRFVRKDQMTILIFAVALELERSPEGCGTRLWSGGTCTR